MSTLSRLARRALGPMTPGAKRSVVMLFVLALALSAANLLFTTNEVSANNRQWCDTLALLTSKPVPKPTDPHANPSRMQNYTLYADFVTLRRHFGC